MPVHIFKLANLKDNRYLSQNKKLLVFDLDGTLTESKQVLKPVMAGLLSRLLRETKVAVIGGGKYQVFQNQFLKKLKAPAALLKNLFIFPTNAAAFYKHKGGWKKVYSRQIPLNQRKLAKSAILKALVKAHFQIPKKLFGPPIEDRESQITFSALGQKAPLNLKQNWNRRSDSRPRIMRFLKIYLPGFEIREGGLTSIDINMKGIDKKYGLRQIMKRLQTPRSSVLFVGDALYPGGNDYPACQAGVDCLFVAGPEETKRFIRLFLKKQEKLKNL